MSYQREWRTIYAKIEGIRVSAELWARFKQASYADSYGSYKEIGKACHSAAQDILGLAAKYEASLPVPVRERIEEFFTDQRRNLIDEAKSELKAATSALIMLLALRAEIEFLLTDEQEQIRSKTERAFLHLQRLLAVDSDAQSKWSDAFDKGETACENLGAVHLLLFGIFAFKANAVGARTDLIFPDQDDHDDFESRGVAGLVLTEWKVANPENGLSKFAEARAQMDIYRQSALVGVELTGTRYAVVLTKKKLPKSQVPEDMDRNGVIYRHLNLAIAPETPSKQAKRDR